jgi:hypothetical protein
MTMVSDIKGGVDLWLAVVILGRGVQDSETVEE